MNDSHAALTVQLLEWLSSRPRTHADVLEAWRTTCPRLSIWEDACIDGLIDRDGDMVIVSREGRILLQKSHENNDPR
jgi:hypothetical protein